MSSTAQTNQTYDIVVVGGGGAGLSGAKIAARSRRSVLVIDSGAPRNAPADGVHNYLYAEGTSPARLGETGRAEAAAYDVQIVHGTAAHARLLDCAAARAPRFTIEIDVPDGGTRTVSARRVLLATGLVDELPQIPGLRERWGKDVLHCPFCHGWEVRDRAVGVIGTNAMALHTVQLFRALTPDVVYFQHTAPDPTDEQLHLLAALGVRHVTGEVSSVETTDHALSGVRTADGQVIGREAIAIATFLRGRADLIADLGLQLTDLEMAGAVIGTYLPADASGLTATPGVWAAGNITAPMAQVINAAAAGAATGAAIHMDLMAEDNQAAVAAYHASHEAAPEVGAGEAFWEPHYVKSAPGTGGPNVVLVDTVEHLAAGNALDLGCGGGGDAVWLAQNGWSVTSVDVSPTALARVADRAAKEGVSERVATERHDLTATFPHGSFDLVSAQYLLSPVEFDRPPIFARAASAVRPGGTLLIVDHASVPPWSWADKATVFPTPADVLDSIGLDPGLWDVTRLENSDRTADGPGGQRAVVTDMIIALTRRGATA